MFASIVAALLLVPTVHGAYCSGVPAAGRYLVLLLISVFIILS